MFSIDLFAILSKIILVINMIMHWQYTSYSIFLIMAIISFSRSALLGICMLDRMFHSILVAYLRSDMEPPISYVSNYLVISII